jgi:hypothetical protein
VATAAARIAEVNLWTLAGIDIAKEKARGIARRAGWGPR